MEGVGVCLRINGDGADVHFSAGAEEADGDFAPIGDENFGKQRRCRHG